MDQVGMREGCLRQLLWSQKMKPDYPFLHRWDPSRYPPGYLRLGLSERLVQQSVIRYLEAKWRALVTVIDAGDRRLRGQAAAVIRRAGADPRSICRRQTGTSAGVVDLAVTFRDGRAGWFEVKRPAKIISSPKTGRQVQASTPGCPTDSQLRFLSRQSDAGALVGVVWWAGDLDSIIPAGYGLSGYRTPEPMLDDDLAYPPYTLD